MRVMRSRISVIAPIFALAGGMAALGVSYAMPKTWISRSVIDVAVPAGVRISDPLGFLARYVLTDNFLAQLASKYDLYPNVSVPVQRMRKGIMIRPARQKNEVEISFVHPDRTVAGVVTNEITRRFIEGNFEIQYEEGREGRADPTTRFVPMRLRLVDPAATALLRINPLAGASGGLAGGLVLGIVAGWALRRWTARRSAVAPGQG
jgi:hypothetical protein